MENLSNDVEKVVRVAIGVLLEARAEGLCVLIARRPRDTVLAGFWELPGGKIEPDEEPAGALEREFEEELGVRIAVGAALPVIEHRYEHATVRLHPFYCRRVAGEPRNREVEAHRWVRPRELGSYEFPAANAPLIRLVIEQLAGDGRVGDGPAGVEATAVDPGKAAQG